MKYTKPFKGMFPQNITQGFHSAHPALDIISLLPNRGFGTPLCAPENGTIESIIRGDTFTPDSHVDFLRGYGLWFRGAETGHRHLIWHTQPIFPVWGGDLAKRGQIIAWMGNSGYVVSDGKYVELENRDHSPTLEPAGTHLHWETWENGVQIDPLPNIDWGSEPNYSTWEYLEAMRKTLWKMFQLIGKEK